MGTACPNARFIKGTCSEHGNVHWLMVPCKTRTCEECGPVGRYKIASRIAIGCRTLAPAAWITLTFRRDVDKKVAVRKMATFIRWLRTTPGNAGMEYVATYELTKKGRLHINLIVAPWTSVYQRVLARKWGARLWVEWVKDDRGMGVEAAAAYNPEALAGYLSKIEQAVPQDRRVSYSKGWPKLPDTPPTEHPVKYEFMDEGRQLTFRGLMARGLVVEVEPGIFVARHHAKEHPACTCFEPPGRNGHQARAPASATDPPR